MKSSTALFAFLALALAALVQAQTDLSKKADEQRGKLAASKASIEVLVAEANAKGPEFEKCTTGAAAKEKAFAAATAAIDGCLTKTADAKPPCLSKDAACLALINASTAKKQAKAVKCMKKAVDSVDPVVLRLTVEIAKCVQETSKNFTPLPSARWKVPWGLLWNIGKIAFKGREEIKQG